MLLLYKYTCYTIFSIIFTSQNLAVNPNGRVFLVCLLKQPSIVHPRAASRVNCRPYSVSPRPGGATVANYCLPGNNIRV